MGAQGSSPRAVAFRRHAPRYLLFGAVVGIALLHPVTEVIYWFGSHDRFVTESASLWDAVVGRLLLAFTPAMLPMTGLFACVGAGVGWSFWLYASTVERSAAATTSGSEHLSPSLATLLAEGEGERVEFKASARWDAQLGRVNRALEEEVARTIAGFLNHAGGTLLIGVTDDGQIAGLGSDYRTLKRRDRDGFHQFLMTLVQAKLGGHNCAQVHVEFGIVSEMEICQVQVHASDTPVYYLDGSVARYFVRTGNGTRALDVREAIVHMERRRAGGRADGADPGSTIGGAP